MNFPQEFQKEMIRILGDDGYEEYLNSFDLNRFYGLRVNTSKISVKEFLEISPFKLSKVPWIDNGFYYDGDHETPSKHPFYHAGLYYLQEPSAMTPASLMPVDAGDRILDICAAPGGKSTELGAKLKTEDEKHPEIPSGILVSNDISSSRAKALLKNIEVFGIGNCMVTCEEPSELSKRFPNFFDKILIDAPCSGEGMFRKEHKMINAWLEHGPDFFGKIQRNIIKEAAKMLKNGGIIVYSTCTFSVYENEGTINDFLKEHEDFHVVDVSELPGGNYEGFDHGHPELIEGASEEIKNAIRIWPHKMNGEGHFICMLKKEDISAVSDQSIKINNHGNSSLKKSIPDIDEKPFKLLFDKISSTYHYVIDQHNEQVFLIPDYLTGMKGLRFLRSGLYFGNLKKGRFEPSQALAMTLNSKDFDCTINLKADDSRVLKYLKGETIENDPDSIVKGYVLVLLEGYPLGWTKANGNLLKNKYLPGWRITW